MLVDPGSFAILALITVAGALVQATFGFGFAILAAPLFLVVMDSNGAIPVLAVLNLIVSALIAARSWRLAPLRLLMLLCAGSIAGFPIGLMLFRNATLPQLKAAVGLVIMAFALLLLARERGYMAGAQREGDPERQPGAPLALAMGAISGLMTAALAMPGPVAMLYLASCRLAKDEVRALSLAFFSFAYAVVALLHRFDGGLGADRLWLIAGLSVFVAIGGIAGQALARYISEAGFRYWVLAILFLAGLYALLSA